MKNPYGALVVAFGAMLSGKTGEAQTAPPVILEIDTQNQVQYFQDASDVSKFAADPGVTTASTARNFFLALAIADLVAVNGQPVRGTFASGGTSVTLRTAPTPGQAIADTVRSAVNQYTYEILKSDGTPIGTIIATGIGAGSPPPGAPLDAVGTNAAIVGGTGAFLGARGQINTGVVTTASRVASITEIQATGA